MPIKDDSVNLTGLSPQIVFALQEAREVYREYGAEMIITSANDATHSLTSLHYAGNAVDLRTRNLPEGTGSEVAGVVKGRLNVDFDVLFEGDHIHIEYQPRRR